MLRFKDHIISLAAVFLALGLGILIGSGMGDDMLVKQQRLIIDQMSRDFQALREETIQLEAQIRLLNRDIYLWEKYQEALYPAMVSGALAGKKTAIIKYGAKVPDGLTQILEDAGVITTSLLSIDLGRDWKGPATLLGGALAELVGGNPLSGPEKETLDEKLLGGRIHLPNRQAGVPDMVIILVGNEKYVNAELVKTLCYRLAEANLPVVALESSDIQDSLLGAFREFGFSTIDNVDTIFGQVTLLSVLAGRTGHFGIKQGTEQFVVPFIPAGVNY